MSGNSTYKIANIHGQTAITDIADETKKLNFDLTNLTTATTRNIIMPDSDVTIVDLSLTQTLTNKTFNADSNTLTNVDNNDIKAAAGINATKIANGSVSNTNFQYINSLGSTAVGESDTQTLTNKTFTDSLTTFQDNSDNTKKVQFQLSGITTGTTKTFTFPDANTTLIGTEVTQVLTNKTIDADNNTITNIDNNDIKSSAAIDATKIADGSVTNAEFQRINALLSTAVGISDTQTLTNKTFTDNTTYFQDNVDNTKKLQLELSGIATSTTRTLTIPDVNTTLVGTGATQTLTNKTINADSNTITNIDNADIKAGATIDATKIADGSVTNTEFQYINTLSSNVQTQINDHTGASTAHGVSGTLVGTSDTQTLTNKTINSDNNTITNIVNADIKAAAAIDATKIADGSVSSTEFQYINTLSSNVQTQINNHTGTSAAHGVSGDLVGTTDTQTLTNKTLTDNTTYFQDDGDNTKKLQLQLSGITTATTRTLTIPDTNDTIATLAATQTLTNKTIDADNNTITNIENADIKAAAAIDATKIADGSVSNTEFQYINTLSSNVQTQINNHTGDTSAHGVSGNVVGTTDTQTLTNKTLTSPVLTTPQINDTSLDHQYIFGVNELTLDRTVTLPLLTSNDTFVFEVHTQTLTNKSIDADNNTITNIDNADIKAAAAIDATKIADGSVTNTEFQYINTLTSNAQTQINNHLADTSTHGVSGAIVGTTDAQTLTNKTWGDTLDMNSNKIINLTTPTADSDAANKSYVDSVISGLDVKDSVNLTTTEDLDSNTSISGSITYNATAGSSGRGQITATLATTDTFTLDGVNLGAADDGTRVLIKDQSSGAENGIWTTTISGTSLTLDRATDFDEDAEVTSGAFCFVEEGTMYGDNGFTLTTNDPIIIGGGSGTALVFTQFSGAGQVVAGDGLTKSGNTVNAVGSTTIIANDNDLKVNSSGTANQILLSSGTAGTASTFGALPLGDSNAVTGVLNIANGGSNASSFTAGSRIVSTNSGNTALEATTIDPTNVVLLAGTQTLTNKTLTDNTTYFQDNGDNTKKLQLELSGITTATTRTLTIPDANTTIVGHDTIQTLTNKSIDADNNTITNIENADIKAAAAIDASKIANGSVSNTEFQRLATIGSAAVGETDTQTLTNKTFTDSSTYFQDDGDNTKKLQLQLSGITTATTRTLTMPDATTTIVGHDTTQTLTNKTMDFDNNTITNIDNANIKAGAAIDATKIADGSVTDTEFQYLNTVTSNVQTQLDGMVTLSTNQTISGEKTFSAHGAIGGNASIQTDDILRIDEVISAGGTLEGIDIRVKADAASAGQYIIRGVAGYAIVDDVNYNAGSRADGLLYGVYGNGTTAGDATNLDVYGLSAGVFMTNAVTLNVNDAYGANLFVGRDLLGTTGVINATDAYILKLDNGDDGLNATNHYGLYIEEPTRGTTNYTIYTAGGDHRLGGTLHTTGNITTDGTVDGRDVAGDGSTLDSHISATSAHGVSGDIVGTTSTQTLTNKTFTDSTTYFQDEGDNTKKLQLELSGITTSTTRTLTIPNANTTIVGTDTTQTLTNKTLTTPTIQTNLITTSSYIEVADISAPANPGAGKGRLYKKTGNDGIFYKPDAAGSEVDLTTSGTTYVAIIRDQKTSGTNGGTFTSGAWQTRTLSNILGSAYASTDVTISSNQITIKAGKYHISAKSTAYRVDSNVLRFRNITDSTTDIEGMTNYSNSSNQGKVHNVSCLEGYLNLGAQKTFELQHRCTNTKSNDGFGFAHGISGVNEVYTTITVTKLE